VVLVLGNFTCGPFRGLYPEMETFYERYKDQATFLMVYVREAHPSDGWHMESNTRAGVKVAQPKTLEERVQVCGQFCRKLKPTMPVVVDDISDPVGTAYSGMPGRMYVIDSKGEVAYKSGRGPFGFRAGELEQALVMCLLEAERVRMSVFPPAANDAAWAVLPGQQPPLPEWARVLVTPMPRATTRLLELDYIHRARNPLGPELAGRLQWAVADALQSAGGKATAEADLRRAGLTDKQLADLGSPADPALRTAVSFARKLSLEGHAITDGEFAEMLKLFGPEKLVAIVHTIAYANFHNRLVLGLGTGGDPLPPVQLKVDPDRYAKLTAPTRPPWDDLGAVTAGGLAIRPDWDKATAEELGTNLDRQKERALRIPLPTSDRLAALPPKERESAEKILWNTVSSGYQPLLTRTWFAALYGFYEDARVDRVFTNATFWVVTRTNQCFY
jgi:alkylhydroperoxidase family enzyme